MTDFRFRSCTSMLALVAVAVVVALGAAAPAALAQGTAAAASKPRTGDYILAIVNQELVTARELEQRIARIRDEASRNKQTLPADDELRRQVLDAMIDDRVQVTHARESGQRIDDGELERAVANVAAQNQISPGELRERLRREGIDYIRFRLNVRDQLLVERVREREVQALIRISDEEVDNLIEARRKEAGGVAEYNIAQILVTVPEGADAATLAARRALAESAQTRVKAGEAFELVARELSEDPNKAQGGVIGLRSAARLPDVFVETVRPLRAGEVAPALLRTGAGFHLLKLVDKREGNPFVITQTRARHILLRPSPQLSTEAVTARLIEYRREILAGRRSFEQLARDNSEDGSAAAGGDLGWTSPGTFVPEFEQAMNALPIDGISEPVPSRFGVHLIQVVERRQATLELRQLREQARAALREQKFEAAYTEWLAELRARAYVEMREPPQ